MAKSFNRNVTETIDGRYVRQQEAIREVCKSLNLVAFYPDYHADKRDKNTVIIYTKEGHEYNKKVPYWDSTSKEKGRVCTFENTDINGMFDLNYMNNGSIKMICTNEKEEIENFIKKCLASIKG